VIGKPWLLLLSFLLLVSFSHPPGYSKNQNTAEPQAAPKTSSSNDNYPRVNKATWYEVDASWPKKPPQFEWGAVSGIAVDQKENVWIFNRSQPAIQVYSSDGEFIRSWLNEQETVAHHIKIDTEGNVWLADIGLHVIRKYTQEGKLLLTLGTPGQPGQDESHLDKPTDMAIAANGDIFVTDGYGNNRVVHFDGKGKFVKEWGSLGVNADQFSLPHAIAIDSKGKLYIADRNNVRVQVYDQKGNLTDSWQNIIVPWGFWISLDDEIWVCGSSPMQWRNDSKYPAAPLGCPPKDQVFMKFNANGKLLQQWTVPKGKDEKEKPGEVNWLHTMALDSYGNIYCGDIIGKRAQKFVRKN